TIVGEGNTTITANQAGDSNWNPATGVPQILRVDPAINRGLVAYYPFEGDAKDTSGNKNDGTSLGNYSYVSSAGRTAIAVVGTATEGYQGGGYVRLPAFAGYISNTLTVNIWARGEQVPVGPSDEHYFSFGNMWGANNSAWLGVGGTEIHVGRNDTSNNYVQMKIDLPTEFFSNWHMVTMVLTPTSLTGYLNGVPFANTNGVFAGLNLDYFNAIASHRWRSSEQSARLTAQLANARVYGRALSADEVGSLFAAEAGNLDTDGDGLTDAWEQGYGRYQVIPGSFTWEQAKADAEARGGHLATITSDSEKAFTETFTGTFIPSGSGVNLIWLGASDGETEGVWKWVTGERWGFTAWYPGEPNNDGNQDCLILEYSNHVYWDDFYGTSPASYLLEFGYPTDPTKADADGDGFNDSIESHYASDPNNAAVTPDTIRPAGAVIAWGDNQVGQTNVPSSISNNAIQISSGYAHALALKKDGSVVAWGENLYSKSTLPAGLTNVVSVSAGAEHSVAL
ncbi:MAG: hypothetical protein EBT69_08615, partial [Verrucomicrobia bacterium]|nr:hypothetical protein [Verrucomicrobiota bacterium]